MKRHTISTSGRMAGLVKRYHTWPVSREQTVAEHTWQVMRIWWQIFGPMPEAVSTFLLWHDAGEIGTGDLPFPIKARNQELKTMMDRLEREALELMVGVDRTNDLVVIDNESMLKCKACDLIEMHEFGAEELLRGNKFAQPIEHDTFDCITKIASKLPPADEQKVLNYLYRWRATWSR